MKKCTACNSRLFLGGEDYRGLRFCNQNCISRFKVNLAETFLGEEFIKKQIDTLFDSNCPTCNGPGPLEVFKAKKITGMILAYQTQESSILGCLKCGKNHKMKAGLHCLAFGWWGPKSFVYNLFIMPSNFITMFMISVPGRPSDTFAVRVKEILAEQNIELLWGKLIESAQSSGSNKDGA